VPTLFDIKWLNILVQHLMAKKILIIILIYQTYEYNTKIVGTSSSIFVSTNQESKFDHRFEYSFNGPTLVISKYTEQWKEEYWVFK